MSDMHRFVIPLVCAGLALIFAPGVATAPDPVKILEQSDRARGGGLPGIVWEIRMATGDEAEPSAVERHLLVKAIRNSSVAETLEPVRFKGSKLLQVERNMWMTRPGLRKPIPISPRQKLMGQAANGDIAATNYAGDYHAMLVGEDVLAGETCYRLELSAKNKKVTYDRVRYWVSAARGVGVKAEFYSLSGKLLKTASFEYGNTIQHNGQRFPFVSRMEIRDALTNEITQLVYQAVKVKSVPAAEFEVGSLE